MDNGVARRQHRRLSRMAERGVSRTTVMVHEACREALDTIRPLLLDPSNAVFLRTALATADGDPRPVNVSQVRQLSPFRYPGGKTWCIPEVRGWLDGLHRKPNVLVEPFAGGGIVSLTVAMERCTDKVVMCELDSDVASVWRTLVHGDLQEFEALCQKVASFLVDRDHVLALLAAPAESTADRAFRTIVKNRVNRGGILAPGASLQKNGENGKGLASRWYPETLIKRFHAIRSIRERITFVEGDGMKVIEDHRRRKGAAFFVDPPYTAGGKKAGSRLYSHNALDHERLFATMAGVAGDFLMTYDDSDEVRALVERHRFTIKEVPMKSTHHALHRELLIFKGE